MNEVSKLRFRVERTTGDPIYEQERSNRFNPGIVEKGGKIIGHKAIERRILQEFINNVWTDVQTFDPIEGDNS